jgi:hypothetical protein
VTPVEEAREEIVGDCIAYADGRSALRAALDKFQREVENDAMERAAAAAMRFAGHACEAQSAAMAIRAQKHVLS